MFPTASAGAELGLSGPGDQPTVGGSDGPEHGDRGPNTRKALKLSWNDQSVLPQHRDFLGQNPLQCQVGVADIEGSAATPSPAAVASHWPVMLLVWIWVR